MADLGCAAAGKAARLRGTCVSEAAALGSKHTNTALGSPALPTVEGIDWEVQCHKTQQGLISLLSPQPLPRLRVPPTYLQGICHRAPLDGLAVSRAVNHDEPHSRCHCCHQHGLNHLEAGPVDVPVKRAEERGCHPGVQAGSPTAWLGTSHQAYRQAGCLCSLPRPCQAVLHSVLWQSCHGYLGQEASSKSSFAQPAPADLPASPAWSRAQLPGKGWRDLAGGTGQNQAQKAAAREGPRGVTLWKLLPALHRSTSIGHPSLRPQGRSWCLKSW